MLESPEVEQLRAEVERLAQENRDLRTRSEKVDPLEQEIAQLRENVHKLQQWNAGAGQRIGYVFLIVDY